MQAIRLDKQQSSVAVQSPGALQVCDASGKPVGQFVPNHRLSTHRWCECWNDWYFGRDDAEKPETD